MSRSPVAFCSILVVALVAGCSSSTTASSPSTQPAVSTPAKVAALFEDRGPYPVGVITKTLPLGNKVEIWYPATKNTTGSETYDLRNFVSPAIKALLTANVPATVTYEAKRNATAAAGKFPIVLFSHGFSGMRLQSTFLTAHLASWGMIVAAPDHPSRDLFHILGGAPKQDSVGDLAAVLTLLKDETVASGSVLQGHVDTEHIAAVGHSAGGGTVVGATNRLSEIDGYVSLASGFFGGASTATSVGATTTTVAVPQKPSLFIAGANDHIAVFDKVTKPAYDAAAKPSRLWVIDKAGHNAFDDFCTVGNGAGIIGVAEASGLGPALSSGPLSFAKKLGEDGCKPPNVAVTTVYPIIRHAVVAWLRELFGTDKTARGLSGAVATQYPVNVTISEKLG